MITVRREKPEDAPAVREVNRLAFGRDEEAELVDAVRDTPGVISIEAWRFGRDKRPGPLPASIHQVVAIPIRARSKAPGGSHCHARAGRPG